MAFTNYASGCLKSNSAAQPYLNNRLKMKTMRNSVQMESRNTGKRSVWQMKMLLRMKLASPK